MLSAQQLVVYYLLAVHDYGMHTLGVDPQTREPVFLTAPNKVSGHECYWTIVWCQNTYWKTSPFWRDLKLPCRRTFLRLMKSYAFKANDSWGGLYSKFTSSVREQVVASRANASEMITQVEAQLKRYRHHKMEAHLYQRVPSYTTKPHQKSQKNAI